MLVAIVTLNAVCVVVSDSWSHDSLGTMSIFTFTVIIALFSVPSFQGIKKCEKIDTCRCSTDEGEINLWSLAGETTNQPRYDNETKKRFDHLLGFLSLRLYDESGNRKGKDPRTCCTKQTPRLMSSPYRGGSKIWTQVIAVRIYILSINLWIWFKACFKASWATLVLGFQYPYQPKQNCLGFAILANFN